MAIPPDPIEDVFPSVHRAVVGEVVEVLAEDPQAPLPPSEPGMTDVPGDVAAQTIALRVERVLVGNGVVGDTLTVRKPAGDYKLKVGNRGPFLLDEEEVPFILGRYGPDTYPEAVILAAAQRLRR